MNYGVILQYDEEEFVAGAANELTFDYEVNTWIDYLVRGERQRRGRLETMACVTFSALSDIETHFNYQKMHNMITVENWTWLQEKGYIENGELNLSDRFTAKMSGTRKEGNTGSAVAYSMYKHGVVPESVWPYTDGLSWDEFYAEIHEDVKALGLEWVERFTINYQRVHHFDWDRLRKHSPLQIYVHAWGKEIVDDVYQKTTAGINHAIMDYHKDEVRYIFDTYDPFIKKLALDYMHYAWGYVYKLTQNKTAMKLLRNSDTEEIFAVLPSGKLSHIHSMIHLEKGLEEGLWESEWEEKTADEMAQYEVTNSLIFAL